MTAWGHLVLFPVVANIESLPASYADTSADIHHCLVWSLEYENVFVLLLPLVLVGSLCSTVARWYYHGS
jgi:hypothetical protein